MGGLIGESRKPMKCLDFKRGAILTSNPNRWLTTACPFFTGSWIAILRGNFASGLPNTFCIAKNIRLCQSELGNQCARFRHRSGQFSLAGFCNETAEFSLLGEKRFEIGHGVRAFKLMFWLSISYAYDHFKTSISSHSLLSPWQQKQPSPLLDASLSQGHFVCKTRRRRWNRTASPGHIGKANKPTRVSCIDCSGQRCLLW